MDKVEEEPITDVPGVDVTEEPEEHPSALGNAKVATNTTDVSLTIHEAVENGRLDTVKDILTKRKKKGANEVNEQGYTPLHIAAQHGHIDIIDLLLEYGSRINERGHNDGSTPLHKAVENGQMEAVEWLIGAKGIEYDISPFLHDNEECTVLHTAAIRGDDGILKTLLELPSSVKHINDRDYSERTPLYYAKRSNNISKETIKLLEPQERNKKVDLRKLSKLGSIGKHWANVAAENPIEKCCVTGDFDGLKNKLKKREDDLKLKKETEEEKEKRYGKELSKENKPAKLRELEDQIKKLRPTFQLYSIHRACELEDTNAIEDWVKHDVAYVDAKDRNGYTPLMVAVAKGKRKVVKFLLDEDDNYKSTPYKANLYITNNEMKNCLHIAVESFTAEQTEGKKILKKIIKDGASWMINSVDKRHRTPLHYAAELGNHEALEILLREASHMDSDNEGMSPLHLAAEKGSLECVKLIVNREWYGTDKKKDIIDQKDSKERTALKIAAKNGNSEICRFLLENGADVKAMKSAQHQFFVDIFKDLLENPPQRDTDADDDVKCYDFSLIKDEIDCLEALIPQIEEVKKKTFALRMWDHVKFYSTLVTCPLLPSLNIKDIVSKNWATKTIGKMKKQIYFILEEAMKGEKGVTMTYSNHKVIKMLRKDMQNKKGEQKYVIMKEIIKLVPVVAKYLLDKSVEEKEIDEETEGNNDNMESGSGNTDVLIKEKSTDLEEGIDTEKINSKEGKDTGKEQGNDIIEKETKKTQKTYYFDLFDAKHAVGVREPFFAPIAMKTYHRDLLKEDLTQRLMTVKYNRLGMPFATFGFAFYVLFLALLTTTVVMEKQNEQAFAADGTKINIDEYYHLYNNISEGKVNKKTHVVYTIFGSSFMKPLCEKQVITNRKRKYQKEIMFSAMNITMICNITNPKIKSITNLTQKLYESGLDTNDLCKVSKFNDSDAGTNGTNGGNGGGNDSGHTGTGTHLVDHSTHIVRRVEINLNIICPLDVTRIDQVKVLSWVIFFIAIFLVLKEFLRFRFMLTMAMVIQDPLHVLEVFTYLFTVVFLGPFLKVSNLISLDVDYLFRWKWEAGALAILVGWITLLLYMKTVPVFGIYVWMFEEVTKTVVKVVFALFFLLVAFASCWYMLLSQSLKHYRVYGDAFMKTFRLTFGEFEFDKMFVDSELQYENLTFVVYFAFLMLMPILFMNLLVGLAVGDIGAVEDSAGDRHINNRVMALENYNKTFPKLLLENLYKKKDSPVPFRQKLSNLAFWKKENKENKKNKENKENKEKGTGFKGATNSAYELDTKHTPNVV